MDELKESSLLFSLKQLERMEKDRQRRQRHQLAKAAAERKRRERSLNEARASVEERLVRAEEAVCRASEREQEAQADRLAQVRKVTALEVKLDAAQKLHREQIALAREHATKLAASRLNSRLMGFKVGLAICVFITLGAIGSAGALLSRAQAAEQRSRHDLEQRATSHKLEQARLAQHLQRARADAESLSRRVIELKELLALRSKTQTAVPPTAPSRTSGGKSPGSRDGVERPSFSGRALATARCKKAELGDPLNPCLP